LLESFSGILGMHVNNEQKRKRDKDVKEELGRMEISSRFYLLVSTQRSTHTLATVLAGELNKPSKLST